MLLLTIFKNVWNGGKLNAPHLYLRNMSTHITKLGQCKTTSCSNLFLQKRTFFGIFRRPTVKQCRITDNIPDQYQLIYRSRMDRYILYAQIVTTVCTLGMVLFTIIIEKPHQTVDTVQITSWQTDTDTFLFLTFFIAVVVILQVIVSQMPIRMYYLGQQKRYVLVFYGNVPFTQKQLSCKIGDLKKLPEKGISPWKQCKYKVKDKNKLILIEDYFRRPADLYVMLGIQNDPDVYENN